MGEWCSSKKELTVRDESELADYDTSSRIIYSLIT